MPHDPTEMVPFFLTAIRERLGQALAAAAGAEACLGHGDAAGALRIALDIEPPLYEAKTLLEAATLVGRFGKDDL